MFPKVSPTELIIVLLIVVLLFGAGRIGKIAGELGRGIREFRSGLKDQDAEAKPEASAPEAEAPKENKTE